MAAVSSKDVVSLLNVVVAEKETRAQPSKSRPLSLILSVRNPTIPSLKDIAHAKELNENHSRCSTLQHHFP
jgi:hypothetical protein